MSNSGSFVSKYTPQSLIMVGVVVLLVAALAMTATPVLTGGSHGVSPPVKFGSLIEHAPSYVHCKAQVAAINRVIARVEANTRFSPARKARLLARFNARLVTINVRCGF